MVLKIAQHCDILHSVALAAGSQQSIDLLLDFSFTVLDNKTVSSTENLAIQIRSVGEKLTQLADIETDLIDVGAKQASSQQKA